MMEHHFVLGHIPAVLYGPDSDRVWLYLHGKCGYKEEAEHWFHTPGQLSTLKRWEQTHI